MFPNLWIFDTYSICLVVGVFVAILVLYQYLKKYTGNMQYAYSVLILATLTILFGILSATLFQYIFNLLDGINEFGAMTFYGGLIGGTGFFILFYFIFIKKKYNISILNIVIIAPACIALAHAFGRIGCFADGCCYGIETDSFLGVKFPFLDHKVYPTQLFESAFLFILGGLLYYLAIKKNNKYTMPIYLLSYGVWRFLIEFIRGDDRGARLFGLYPAQVISILLVLAGIVLIILIIKKVLFKEPNEELEKGETE